MTTYKYEAISFSGAAVNGVIEAHDENDAIMRIKENCSVINKLTEVKANPLEVFYYPDGGPAHR